jgi:DNA-binding LytR/AlgR family response regulator
MMIHPALKNYGYAIVYVLLFMVVTSALAFSLFPLYPPISFTWLVLDGVIFGVLFAIIGIPLWMVVQFVDFSKQTVIQQIIYAVCMCCITLFVWLAIAYGIVYIIMPIAVFEVIWTSIFVRLVVGLMMYIATWQLYKRLLFEISDDDTIIEKQEKTTDIESKIRIDKIVIKDGSTMQVLQLHDIIYIQAEGDYALIRTNDGRYIKEQTMKAFEQQLPPQQFVRVHRSYIVALAALKGVELYEKQQYLLHLKNGEKIKMSINGYKLLKQQLAL